MRQSDDWEKSSNITLFPYHINGAPAIITTSPTIPDEIRTLDVNDEYSNVLKNIDAQGQHIREYDGNRHTFIAKPDAEPYVTMH